jgi:ATP-dependent protease HslVU (ClpYQ) ATPase subunit
MRRLKLGQLLDTLPERLALARSNRLPHHDFLEMLLADAVTRRDRQSVGPVGVGKTFLANALAHIAVRRHHSVHTERAD